MAVHGGAAAGENGAVEAIFFGAEAEGRLGAVPEAEVVTGQGIRGDRYFRGDGAGTFHKPDKRGQDLTLVEAEAIEHLAAQGIEIEPAESRRNVLTRGVDLNSLVGARFRVGEVELTGERLCDPCAHLESLTRPGLLRAMADRGGLRADVTGGGTIRVGDPVRRLD